MTDPKNDTHEPDVSRRERGDLAVLFWSMSKDNKEFADYAAALRISVVERNKEKLLDAAYTLTSIVEDKLPKGLPEKKAWCTHVPFWAHMGDFEYFDRIAFNYNKSEHSNLDHNSFD
ncbi:MAG TPA: hypothetical protein DEA55_06700 [Rhodospirillaceae bacterium]|nr:hypothetical protein [Rhodospirillaceae bacterium]